jgi:WD40 repeat protein
LSVVFSPDSKLVASGAADQTVRLWDVETGSKIRCLRGQTSEIWSIVFHPNGQEIYSAGSEKMIRVWDVRRDSEPKMERRHDGPVYDVAFSPNGTFASAGSRGEVRIWTMDSPTYQQHHCHKSEVRSLAFSPDGRWLITGGADKLAKVWDVANWSEVTRHDEHTDGVHSMAVSPAGDQVASISLFDGVHLWDRRTGRTIKKLRGYADWDAKVAFSRDGSLLGTIDKNVALDKNAAVIWDANTGKEKRSFSTIGPGVWRFHLMARRLPPGEENTTSSSGTPPQAGCCEPFWDIPAGSGTSVSAPTERGWHRRRRPDG